jgi:hypothetical protein
MSRMAVAVAAVDRARTVELVGQVRLPVSTEAAAVAEAVVVPAERAASAVLVRQESSSRLRIRNNGHALQSDEALGR